MKVQFPAPHPTLSNMVEKLQISKNSVLKKFQSKKPQASKWTNGQALLEFARENKLSFAAASAAMLSGTAAAIYSLFSDSNGVENQPNNKCNQNLFRNAITPLQNNTAHNIGNKYSQNFSDNTVATTYLHNNTAHDIGSSNAVTLLSASIVGTALAAVLTGIYLCCKGKKSVPPLFPAKGGVPDEKIAGKFTLDELEVRITHWLQTEFVSGEPTPSSSKEPLIAEPLTALESSLGFTSKPSAQKLDNAVTTLNLFGGNDKERIDFATKMLNSSEVRFGDFKRYIKSEKSIKVDSLKEVAIHYMTDVVLKDVVFKDIYERLGGILFPGIECLQFGGRLIPTASIATYIILVMMGEMYPEIYLLKMKELSAKRNLTVLDRKTFIYAGKALKVMGDTGEQRTKVRDRLKVLIEEELSNPTDIKNQSLILLKNAIEDNIAGKKLTAFKQIIALYAKLLNQDGDYMNYLYSYLGPELASILFEEVDDDKSSLHVAARLIELVPAIYHKRTEQEKYVVYLNRISRPFRDLKEARDKIAENWVRPKKKLILTFSSKESTNLFLEASKYFYPIISDIKNPSALMVLGALTTRIFGPLDHGNLNQWLTYRLIMAFETMPQEGSGSELRSSLNITEDPDVDFSLLLSPCETHVNRSIEYKGE